MAKHLKFNGYLNVFVFPVIRAKVVGQKEVVTGNDAYGYPVKMIRYDVKQMKVSGEYSLSCYPQISI